MLIVSGFAGLICHKCVEAGLIARATRVPSTATVHGVQKDRQLHNGTNTTHQLTAAAEQDTSNLCKTAEDSAATSCTPHTQRQTARQLTSG